MYQWSLDTLHLAQDSLRKHWTPPRSARTSLARRWVARVWSSYNHGGDHGDMTGGWFMIVLTKHLRGYNHQEWNHGDIIGISWGYVANNADMIETWRKKNGRLWPAMNSPMDGLVTCHRWAPSILGDNSCGPDTGWKGHQKDRQVASQMLWWKSVSCLASWDLLYIAVTPLFKWG